MLTRFKLVLLENRSWFFLSAMFFSLGYTLAFYSLSQQPELFRLFEEAAIPFIRELGDMVFSGNPFSGVLVLFVHNLTATIQVMVLGIVLGIPALFSSIANGTLLGAVAARLSQEGIVPLHFFLVGILPHGLFELPAFLLSAAFGLKLGYHVVFPLPGKGRRSTLGHIFSEIKNAFPGIVLLLAAAAFLEVFVTPGLVSTFLKQ